MKKLLLLFAVMLSMVGVVKADVVGLPQITTDLKNPIYYTIVNTRSSEPGGLMYYAGDGIGIKDGGCTSATLEDKYKFFFTGTYDELYVHNAATSNKFAKVGDGQHAKGSWTPDGAQWRVITRADGYLAFGQKDATESEYKWWNECNYSNVAENPDFTMWTASDAGSAFIIELAADYAESRPKANSFYTIECPLFKTPKGLHVKTDGTIEWNTVNLADKNYYWVLTVNDDGTIAFKNLGTGKYLNGTSMSESKVYGTLHALGANRFNIVVNNTTIHAGDHGGGTNEKGNIISWNGCLNSASAWKFVEQTDPDALALVEFTYNFTINGTSVHKVPMEVLKGSELPSYSFPYGVTATLPTGVAEAKTYDIPCEVSLPFDFVLTGEPQDWYFLNFHANGRYYLYYDATNSTKVLDATKTKVDLSKVDAYYWAFIGNPFSGFKVVNKAAGLNTWLNATADGGAFGTADHLFEVTPSTFGVNSKDGFYMAAPKGANTNRFNRQNNKVVYWTGADAGSTFQVTTLATSEDFAMVDLLKSDAGKVGYPKNADALNGFILGEHTKLDINAAVKAYKTNSDIVLPEDGKAYTFMNVMGNNERTQRYMKYVNGQKLAVSTDVNDASVFVCKKLREGVYAFVTADGKVLTWVGNDEGGAYKEDNNIYGYSSYYATAFGGKSDWNEITVKKDATEANAYGQLRLVGRRKSTAFSSFIVNTAGRFDQASDARFFDASNSSAWILTKVEHTNNDAQNLALARVNAKNAIGSRTFGEGVGKYHYVADGENVYTALNVDEIATVDGINDALATVAINQPATGFCRIKSMNGNDANKKGRFLEVNATGTNLAKDGNDPDNKYTSVFYIKDNTILSYSCGQYLNAYKTFATVGAEPTTWVIEENAAIVGTYALQYEENSGHNGYLSDCLPIPAATEENPVPVFEPTNGLNDANAAWTLEEVTWLPVPMNAEIGWATFYSPVQLALSFNRVKAYAGKVNGQYVTLNPLTSVPAETGVILELNTNDALEDGCVFLQVEKTSLTDVDTDLDGTLGDAYVEEESYVLSAPDGVESVGLYKAKKNFVNNEGAWTKADKGTHFLNNGFKAYLPIVSEARFFVFDFGGTETAIEGVEGENGNVKTEIYDLAGRRVQNAQKGVFIVNGKVVIK